MSLYQFIRRLLVWLHWRSSADGRRFFLFVQLQGYDIKELLWFCQWTLSRLMYFFRIAAEVDCCATSGFWVFVQQKIEMQSWSIPIYLLFFFPLFLLFGCPSCVCLNGLHNFQPRTIVSKFFSFKVCGPLFSLLYSTCKLWAFLLTRHLRLIRLWIQGYIQITLLPHEMKSVK